MKKKFMPYTRLSIILSALILIIGLTGCFDESGDSNPEVLAAANGETDSELLGEADIIIQNGRVIDPETGRDEIATVGVKDGTITVIASTPGETYTSTETRRVINADGLIVSPGFINTHTHEGIWEESMKAFASDGITTWIGGNCGYSGGGPMTVSEFIDSMEATGMLNNYAALTGHISLRRAVGVEIFDDATPAQVDQMVGLLQDDLDAGPLNIRSFHLSRW